MLLHHTYTGSALLKGHVTTLYVGPPVLFIGLAGASAIIPGEYFDVNG